MGLFCANFHLRTADEKALSAALAKRKISQFRILPAKNGWVSLYEERASEQDDQRIRDLASGLTKDLCVPAIAFMCHDSDIACYWLYDGGKLLDEYNSCPDYFDEDTAGEGGSSGGQPDVLVRYCKAGVQQSELAKILGGENVFAEVVIEQLADKLGIDPGRALGDYRHDDADDEGDEGPDGFGSFDDDDGGGGRSPDIIPMRGDIAGKLAGMFGVGAAAMKVDPQALALVEAVANDDVEKIDQLLALGVAIHLEAPVSMAGSQPAAGLGQLFAGAAPKIPMTPLLAAIVNKRRRAVERLLDAGADPNHINPIFGSAIHAAVGAGEAELLQLLIDRGGDTKARNAQGQTPMDVIVAGRGTLEQMAQMQAMMKKMGMKMPPGLIDQVANVKLPLEGWDACEKLLKE